MLKTWSSTIFDDYIVRNAHIAARSTDTASVQIAASIQSLARMLEITASKQQEATGRIQGLLELQGAKLQNLQGQVLLFQQAALARSPVRSSQLRVVEGSSSSSSGGGPSSAFSVTAAAAAMPVGVGDAESALPAPAAGIAGSGGAGASSSAAASAAASAFGPLAIGAQPSFIPWRQHAAISGAD